MAEDSKKTTEETLDRYVGNILLPTIVLAFAGIFFVQTFDFPGGGGDVGPAGVPYLWIGFTTLFTIALIIQAIMKKMPPDPVPGKIGFVLLFAGWLVVYLIGIQNAGYYLSTFIFLVVSMYVLGYRRYGVILAVAIGWLVFSYSVFSKFLYIPLPEGPLMRLQVG